MLPEITREHSALLLDLDGTLIDSSHAHASAFAHALEEMGIRRELRYDEIAGMTTESAAAQLAVPAELIPEFVKIKRGLYFNQLRSGNIHPIDGANDLVYSALELGWALALVTSASAESTRVALEVLEWQSTFASVVTSEDVIRGKPYPDSFLLAARNIGAKREQCIGVEDSDAGSQALEAAGIARVLVGDRPFAIQLSELVKHLKTSGTRR